MQSASDAPQALGSGLQALRRSATLPEEMFSGSSRGNRMKATITPQDAGFPVSVSYTEACDAKMEVQNQVQLVSFFPEHVYGISMSVLYARTFTSWNLTPLTKAIAVRVPKPLLLHIRHLPPNARLPTVQFKCPQSKTACSQIPMVHSHGWISLDRDAPSFQRSTVLLDLLLANICSTAPLTDLLST
jgi:hypothetical protein